jgi:hypothetical protein
MSDVRLRELPAYRELAEMRAAARYRVLREMGAHAESWTALPAATQRKLAEVELHTLTDLSRSGARAILRELCAAALGDSEDDGVLFTFAGDDKTERWRLSTATEAWTFTADGADGSFAVPALRGIGDHDEALTRIAISLLGVPRG